MLEADEDALGSFYQNFGEDFESRVLTLSALWDQEETERSERPHFANANFQTADFGEIDIPYVSAKGFSVVIGIDPEEIRNFAEGYQQDNYFRRILQAMRTEEDLENPMYPQYSLSDQGLIFFEDWMGNLRLCVPASKRVEIIKESHDQLTEGAHEGYHKTYNRIAAGYYWPKMSRDIHLYVKTCDICQKSKPKKHAPYGLLQPIPIPSRPFEVVTMDFIPELPLSEGWDDILVIVDKLTKYAIFVPCLTQNKEEEVGAMFFKHIVTHFGLPRQVISD